MNVEWKEKIRKEPRVSQSDDGKAVNRELGTKKALACRVLQDPGARMVMCEEQCWPSLGTRQEARGLSCCTRDLDNRKGKIFRQ